MKSSAEQDLSARYRRFLEEHPLREITVTGAQRWSLIDTRAGSDALILLPGFAGEASTAFLFVTAFEAHFRTLSLSYPASVGRVDALCDGLSALMDEAGIAQSALLGGSSSGFIAQAFVRRHPRRVSRLILTHTGLPDDARARTAGRYLWMLDVLPFGVFRKLALFSVRFFLPQNQPVSLFWRDHFRDVIRRESREAMQNRFALMEDFHSRCRFQPGDLTGWQGKTLILEMNRDHLTSPAERSALRSLYPDARVHVFADTAHYDSVERPDEQIGVILHFLLNS